MNVNDVICVGAEPLAMLDYIAMQQADPAVCEADRRRPGARRELAGIEIPGGELAQLGDMVHGVDVSGACFGTVALDAIIDGSAVAPGDVVIGLPSSGLHSNGYTLARAALDGLARRGPDGRLGRPLGEALLEPTEIYVKPIVELLRSDGRRPRPRPHHLRRDRQPAAAGGRVGYEIDAPLPVPPIFELIHEHGDVSDEEMYEVFNMGCGFCVVVPEERRNRGAGAAADPLPARGASGRVDRTGHEARPPVPVFAGERGRAKPPDPGRGQAGSRQ